MTDRPAITQAQELVAHPERWDDPEAEFDRLMGLASAEELPMFTMLAEGLALAMNGRGPSFSLL